MSDAAFRAALLEQAPDFGLELAPEAVDRYARHFELLLVWNRKVNLTRITEPREAARRHFLESAFLTRLVEAPPRLVDVGSGAGFPGMPLACVWSSTDVALVEPLVKRAVFLKEVAACLGLERVRVRNRAFDAAEVTEDALLVARALDRFDALLPALMSAPAATISLFSEPELLAEAGLLAPERSAVFVPLPDSDRRFVGIFRST